VGENHEIPRSDDMLFGIEETAQLIGVDPDAILTWLRAGMPYVEAGDWETGEGFLLRVSWVIDWHVLVIGYATHMRQEKLIWALRLPA
jgi:hypothetical protein